MKTIILLLSLSLLFVCAVSADENLDGLKREIEALKKRVTALEEDISHRSCRPSGACGKDRGRGGRYKHVAPTELAQRRRAANPRIPDASPWALLQDSGLR
jgi:hypothetical protein